ncbi:MAG: type I DNA topoisomerase [Vallitaleaceae bacterium]|nr:type I DNA topoisomerase [Vallitaleaceae bacterium]
MAKNLVIVESPAKAKTIKKFLGANYKIEASMGHVRDLPKSQLGVDTENDFEPKYITIRGKGELLAKLKKEAKKADKIYLATDPDREGEAISWHLYHALKTDTNQIYRITFNEITKEAVKGSIKAARDIDMDLVDSQQARRILDRVVGYKMSPVLWKKVKKGLSAGRVQSVALKMICEREREIEQFIPEEYWTIDTLLADEKKHQFTSSFYGNANGKLALDHKAAVDQVLNDLKKDQYIVSEIKNSERKRKPLPPFTTSTLQQEAVKKLNFTTSKTMRLAQSLYEGVDIKGHGTVGLITYLRTDSTRVSQEAHQNVLQYIEAHFGNAYVNEKGVQSASKNKTQDAHEAIRPTYVEILPSEIKDELSRDLYRLYQLIWSRFVASRMQEAVYDNQKIRIQNGDYEFRTNVQILKFDGYLKVYEDSNEEVVSKFQLALQEGERLNEIDIQAVQHFTQAPPHYTEASLVKILEENGVGRPSTYAPTISTILARGYVAKEQKKLFPTELGEVVHSMLEGYFKEIISVQFTASLEEKLDEVEEGKIPWKNIIRDFYPEFNEMVLKADEEISKIEIKDVVSDVLCDKCGKNMVVKMGKYGKFLACPGFPECMNTKPLYEIVENVRCPLCQGEIHIKKTKKGRKYYGCENNPTCEFMNWNLPSAIPCEQCGGMTVEKGNKLMCINENCKNIQEKKENSHGNE